MKKKWEVLIENCVTQIHNDSIEKKIFNFLIQFANWTYRLRKLTENLMNLIVKFSGNVITISKREMIPNRKYFCYLWIRTSFSISNSFVRFNAISLLEQMFLNKMCCAIALPRIRIKEDPHIGTLLQNSPKCDRVQYESNIIPWKPLYESLKCLIHPKLWSPFSKRYYLTCSIERVHF